MGINMYNLEIKLETIIVRLLMELFLASPLGIDNIGHCCFCIILMLMILFPLARDIFSFEACIFLLSSLSHFLNLFCLTSWCKKGNEIRIYGLV